MRIAFKNGMFLGAKHTQIFVNVIKAMAKLTAIAEDRISLIHAIK